MKGLPYIKIILLCSGTFFSALAFAVIPTVQPHAMIKKDLAKNKDTAKNSAAGCMACHRSDAVPDRLKK